MKVQHYTTAALMENPFNLKVIKFHDSQDAELLHLTLTPGESMLPHIPPVTLLYYILEGRPTVRMGDEVQDLETESYLENPGGIATCVSNNSDSTVRLLIVKTVKTTEVPVFLDK